MLGTETLLLTVNYYDVQGRQIQVKSNNTVGGSDQITYTFNDITSEMQSREHHHTRSTASLTTLTKYVYDHMGRKKEVYENINNQGEVNLSSYRYSETGQLLTKGLHYNMQISNYAYNERGWLKKVTSPEFSFQLNYNDGTNPQWNGNISNQAWGASAPNANMFTYTYDKLNRLLSGSATGMSESLSYDGMGNMKTLNRNGQVGEYSYYGNANQLRQILNGALATAEYIYNDNGNVTYDGRNGKTISYNILNLPQTVSGGISYTYDFSRRKLRKQGSTTVDYVEGIQYTNGSIDFIQTEEGRAINNGGIYKYEYNLRDHLGNVRYSFDIYNGVKRKIQQDDYFPFGKRVSSYAGSPDNKYLYNGKELQDELGQYDYGARFYDPVIGRWNVVDPMAEKYPSWSPYNYAVNNPVNYIDLDGRDIDPASQREWDKQKGYVTKERDRLQKRSDNLTAKAEKKGWSTEKLANKMGNIGERVNSLNGTLNTLGTLENSSQMYSLKTGAVGEGGTTLDPTTGNIVFSFGSTANFVHETAHGGQFEAGEIAFTSTGQTLGQDLSDEISAYKSQFAYKPSSISGLTSSSVANSFGGITTSWVQGITNTVTGSKPYGAGGSANTGLVPININSSRDALIQAYPNAPGLRTLPANYMLKSIPGIYYKR